MIEKFATFGLQNKLLVSLKDAAEKFYPKAEEIISAVRSMPASEYSDYVRQNFPGISYGKVGFMSGQLGRGDLPTFDSRQKQLVYGRDVNVTKERLLEQRDRLLNLGIKVPEKYKEFAQTLLHHEVWDRLNKSDTEHGEIKNAMLKFMPDDAGYLSAVKSGDTKAQQQMVDEAAKAAGYSVGPVYHGTGPEKFNVFEETTGDTGFFFASQKGDASGYGDRIIPAFLKMGRNYQVTAAEFEAGGVWGATQAKEQGYDSFTMDYGDGDVNHAVFNPSQIKSADPITRDAQGNVIPLSQRFNQGSEDIRFMPEVKFFAPEKLPNGQAWSTDMNYRVIQKTGGKYRVYAPIGTLIGVTESLEQAKRLVEKRNK